MYPRGKQAYHDAHLNTPVTLLVCPQTIQNLPSQTYHRVELQSIEESLKRQATSSA